MEGQREVTQITPTNFVDVGNPKIQARIVRSWEELSFYTSEILSLDMLLIDSNGATLSASVPKNMIGKFGSLFQHGRIFSIENYDVRGAKQTYRPVDTKRIIVFTPSTEVRVLDATRVSIPDYKYTFVEFESLPKQLESGNSTLTDVVGKLSSIAPVKVVTRYDGKKITKREISIENMRGKVIKITLWENSTALISREIIQSHSKPVILIAVSTYVNEFRGKYSLASTNATKLYYNLSIPEVEQLTKRSIVPIRGRSMVGESAIQNRKSILELQDAVWDPKKQENNIFSCRATIQSILDLRSYSSCEKCSKKVEIRGNKTWCTTCQMEVTAVPRYHLEMEVQDSTGRTSFVAFDREVENLILAAPTTGMSKIEQGDHPAKEFETLYLHHQLEFQIKLTEFNMKQHVKTFTAQKMFQIHNGEAKGAEMMNSGPNFQEMKDTDGISVEETETKGKRVTTSDAESTEPKNSQTYKHILSTIY